LSKYLVCLNRCTYSGIIRSVGGSLPISLRSQQPHHHHGRRRKCPPKALHDNKMSLTRKRHRPLRLHWAVVLMPPPSPQVETGRRTQHRRCPPPPLLPRQCLSHCDSLAPAVGCCIVTSLAAPVPLFLCRRLSCCSATSLVAPPPLSLWRLTCAGWLSLRQLS
jgi:hypothetical protein